MLQKLGYLALMWIAIIFAYIMLANMFPAFTSITSNATALMQSTSNMSNYPGSLDVVRTSPLWIWFIPGGLGICVSVVWLRQK